MTSKTEQIMTWKERTAPVKTCNLCGTTKRLTEFNRQRRSADGHHKTCKVCYRQRAKIYRRSYIDIQSGGFALGTATSCYFCDAADNLEVHHITYDPALCLRLCKTCHVRLHQLLNLNTELEEK